MGVRQVSAAVVACGLMSLGSAGCASSSEPTTASIAATDAAASSSAAAVSESALTITDPWVKAAPKGMTAAFGMLKNISEADVTVVSAATPVSNKVELHETVTVDGASRMQPKQGGFVIPAGGSFELKPGGSHIMLMGLNSAVEAGADVLVTLTLSDGSTFSFDAIGKEFKGAQESYAPMDK